MEYLTESIFNFMRDASAKAKGRNYLWYFFHAPMYNIVRAEEAEEILQSSKLITKNMIYELLKPFLGEGLLISTGIFKFCILIPTILKSFKPI